MNKKKGNKVPTGRTVASEIEKHAHFTSMYHINFGEVNDISNEIGNNKPKIVVKMLLLESHETKPG